ncbi:hypothetical protein [Niabella aurantiaca]|uniref:hypothetical protein n=1 Tax=Niabella aurantiaca TaxID=379900 RepID=UPI0003668365|nr:hypothetical protein [Niabella aurantiaca]
MKKSFTEQLNAVREAAQQTIRRIVMHKKSIILFSATGDEDEEWTVDIYDDVPDFPFYSKYGYVQYAAVKEIHLREHGIEVTGILKGDDYPEEVKALLTELDDYSSAALADHLQQDETAPEVTETFYVIEKFPYPQFVLDEEGNVKSFETYEAATEEVSDCQDGFVINF